MIRAIAFVSVTAALLLPTAARAGVDVDPAELSPHVILEAEQPTPPQVNSPGTEPVSNQPPPVRPFTECRVDPVVGTYGCREEDPAPDADEPELTPGDVLRAVREIGLPSLQVKIQPGDETLVNVDTIFYADPQPFERSVTLLGFDVDLVAAPVSYQWVHGDGSVAATDRPGKPYPAMDVTHRYSSPADDVQARVDVTYQVRYRVDGGPWQTIGETLLATGPAAILDVKDAAPVLAKP